MDLVSFASIYLTCIKAVCYATLYCNLLYVIILFQFINIIINAMFVCFLRKIALPFIALCCSSSYLPIPVNDSFIFQNEFQVA